MKTMAVVTHRGSVRIMAAAMLLLSAFLATQAVATPAPGTRVETVVNSLSPTPGVVQSWVSLYSPLPASAGPHPEACDWISYLRFRDANGPADSSSADIVYTGMPGLLAGANWFELLAAQVVQKSSAAGRHAEFWVNSRRSNCLVDRTGLDAATAARDYHVAVDYYYNRRAINGKTFAGFPSGSQVAFLKAVDQAQTLKDWHDLIVNGVPDPAVRERKVLCGGHSLGGILASNFAAWGFGDDPHNPANAGYRQCAGFFAVDSLISSDPADLAGKPVLGGLAGALIDGIDLVTHAIVGLGVAPDLDLGLVITPESFNVLAIAGMAAYFQPNVESDLLRILPRTVGLDLTLRLFLSRNYLQFLGNIPDVRSFRYTNEAFLGALMDNNTQIISIIQQGLGSFDGGPVGIKDFPLPSQIDDIPVIGPLISRSLTPGSYPKVGPLDPHALYTWRNYRAVPGKLWNGASYTKPEQEVTDIREYARGLFEGPATLFEPYFPTELLIDDALGLAAAKTNSPAYERWLYPQGALQKPRGLIFAGDAGVYADARFADIFLALANPGAPLVPIDAPVVRGYTHPDMVTAAPVQNNGKPEQVSQYLTDWGARTVH